MISYLLKSAYKLAITQLVDTTHLHVNVSWNFIWNLQVLWVKLLLWCACHNCLPSGRFQTKGVWCSSYCCHFSSVYVLL